MPSLVWNKSRNVLMYWRFGLEVGALGGRASRPPTRRQARESGELQHRPRLTARGRARRTPSEDLALGRPKAGAMFPTRQRSGVPGGVGTRMEQIPHRVDASHNLTQDQTLRGRAILGEGILPTRPKGAPMLAGARPADKDNRALRRVGGRDALPPRPRSDAGPAPCSLCAYGRQGRQNAFPPTTGFIRRGGRW